MSYQVSQLLAGLGTPILASAEEPIRDALDRMLDKGFSQLPVIRGNQFSFITHESILLALHNFGCTIKSSSLRVQDALVKVNAVYQSTDDLFELLVGMRDFNAAIIVDDGRNITHVVTSYDTSKYFQEWAENIMQVRDIEHSLKRIISAAFKNAAGEIDEEARRSAVEEITSEKVSLQRKFGHAVKHYIAKGTELPVGLRPEIVTSALAELLKPSAGQAAFQASIDATQEEMASQVLDAAASLRERFEKALLAYLTHKSGDIVLDKTLVNEAFKMVYNRSESIKEFGELTLNEYIQLFFNASCWGRCKDMIGLTEAEVLHMLEGVRTARNILAHFRDETVTAQERKQLKVCADWLSDRERLMLDAFAATPRLTTDLPKA
jgi:CBS domain-containing protein